MNTPFTYSDPKRQKRNERGHQLQEQIFDAAAEGEDALGGISLKFDAMRAETGNWFIEYLDNSGKPSGITTTDCEFLLMISQVSHSFLARVSHFRRYLGEVHLKSVKSDEGATGYLLPDDNRYQGWMKEKGLTSAVIFEKM